jgi:phenylacetate-CoA ligase
MKFAVIEDMMRLPFLIKAPIRRNRQRLKLDVATSLARFNRGAFSGEPLIFFIGNERIRESMSERVWLPATLSAS